ncbi:thioredoxin family protein [Peribacillus frigoritolerans]|uniref:Thioredoxin domain-containing protein n=1 Tax=Peribacillus castrilensis TaxID=2897690 RepID=A0AAW9NLV4_9BACI|nr:thioredoxin domain-containing protein [Peribacillus castrilensis]
MYKLIDIYQTECGICKMMNPTIERIKEDYEGRIEVEKVNLDEPHEIDYKEEYSIMSTPTFVFLKEDGSVDCQASGYFPYEELASMCDKLLEGGKEQYDA